MSALLLPLVAILWLSSVVVLVVSTRRYLASRAGDRSPVETVAPAPHSISMRDAVRARFLRDPASAQGLNELVRALYLDRSNFTFNTLAELSDEDRALAKALIETWLAAPSAVQEWEEIYAAIREVPSALGPRALPNPDAKAKQA